MAETTRNLTRKQKLSLAGLAVFGVFIVGLWVFELNRQISDPLALKNPTASPESAAAVSEEEKQRTQDTDGDGLSDWDEFNIHGTSPYLEDSDSDGIPDGTEVKNGTNPNCPEGKDCGAAPAAPPTAASSSNGASSALSEAILSGQIDAATLRQELIGAGVDKQQLDQISDEVLLKTYQGIIASSTK